MLHICIGIRCQELSLTITAKGHLYRISRDVFHYGTCYSSCFRLSTHPWYHIRQYPVFFFKTPIIVNAGAVFTTTHHQLIKFPSCCGPVGAALWPFSFSIW